MHTAGATQKHSCIFKHCTIIRTPNHARRIHITQHHCRVHIFLSTIHSVQHERITMLRNHVPRYEVNRRAATHKNRLVPKQLHSGVTCTSTSVLERCETKHLFFFLYRQQTRIMLRTQTYVFDQLGVNCLSSLGPLKSMKVAHTVGCTRESAAHHRNRAMAPERSPIETVGKV